jgi:hypothetical protein
MQRFLARLTVLWMLVGVLTPAALAVAAPAPHACCKRKAMQEAAANHAQFNEFKCGNHDCCRSLAISQRSEAAPRSTTSVQLQTTKLVARLNVLYCATKLLSSTFVRGPPAAS